MSKISYSYLPFDDFNSEAGEKIGEVFRPYVQIKVQLNHGTISPLLDALVDSGADRNLFPLELGAVLLSLNFKKTKPKVIRGIGNIEINAYPAKFHIWLNNKKYESEADFSPSQKIILLGRQGFFSLFKSISFDETNKFTEIEET